MRPRTFTRVEKIEWLVNKLMYRAVKVESTGCWETHWNKANPSGQMFIGKNEKMPVHRLSYILAHGAIPVGGQIVRSCGNKRCINPQHLHLKKLVKPKRGEYVQTYKFNTLEDIIKYVL